jgi:mannitol-1-phosphate/altronate dehydrogenase
MDTPTITTDEMNRALILLKRDELSKEKLKQKYRKRMSNPEEHDAYLERSRQYYQKNRETILAQRAERYAKDRDILRARVADYQARLNYDV